MDGARIMNAAAASGIPPHEQALGYDSVTFCLTKGLGCPVGALVAGDREFIKDARRYKRSVLGGAMRQAGVIAAAGLYALDHNVARLPEDHTNAKILAGGLAEIPGVALNVAHVESNLVFFDVAGTGLTAKEVVDRLAARGVRMGASGLDAYPCGDPPRRVADRRGARGRGWQQEVLGKARAGAVGE